MTSESVLLKKIDGTVGTLYLNRPDRGNALSPELLLDLHLVLKKWADDDRVRAVVITGSGEKAFSSGYDIQELPKIIPAELEETFTANPLAAALDSVRSYPYPVIAMVNGYMFGAGLNLALCCDLRIGSDRVKAGMPPAKLGLVYPPTGLKFFMDTIGSARTREVFFTGRVYSGRDVKEMGFLDRQVDHDDLGPATYRLAREIAANAPRSLKGIKMIIRMLEDRSELSPEDRHTARKLVDDSFASGDAREGQLAFLEKRKPVFTGK
jgi:enoyl-CoA hydratase